jgi:spermidine/putrescine-binding protein
MTQLDDMRDVIGAWLRHRGYSLNSRDPNELEAAKQDALAAKPNLKAYISAPVKSQLIAGDVWIAHLWNGDATQARAESDSIRFATPREGAMIYLDSLAIPRGARNLRAAHEFINFVLRPRIAAQVADRTGYGSPNGDALALQRNPVQLPTAEELSRLEYQEDLGDATVLWDRVWTEIKAG